MKAYRGVDVQTHVFLTSALVVGDWSASRLGRFDPGKKHPVALDKRFDGSQNRSGRRGEKISPYRDSNLELSASNP
jgi:hypothetical protein